MQPNSKERLRAAAPSAFLRAPGRCRKLVEKVRGMLYVRCRGMPRQLRVI